MYKDIQWFSYLMTNEIKIYSLFLKNILYRELIQLTYSEKTKKKPVNIKNDINWLVFRLRRDGSYVLIEQRFIFI